MAPRPLACNTPNCSLRGIPARVGVCPACAINTKPLPINPVADLMTAIAKAEDKQMPNYGPTIQGVPVVELAEQRDDILMALKSLRALIHDLGVQDADAAWYEAVERADAAIAKAEGR